MKLDAISAQARQFRRHETRYTARLEPQPDHADQFRLSFPDAQNELVVADVSKGGLALRSSFYVPKNLRVRLRVSDVETAATGGAKALIVQAVIRRCTMVDHAPTYQVGLQFLDPGGADEQRLVQSALGVEQQEPATVAAGGKRGSESR